MEEQEFITRLQAGEAKAFEALVHDYQARVYNACLNFVFHREDAEDLAQEVFIEVHRSIATFERRSSLHTWIYRIAVTKSLELLRSRNRKKRASQLLSIFGLQQTGWDVRSQPMDHPGFRLENQERAAHLHAALESIPENQKIAFTLHKLESQSYQEIAAVMNISLGSVESLIFRARKNLQKKLAHFYRQDT